MTSDAHETRALDSPGADRAFLGWPMVGLAFLAQFVATGVTFAAIGNFILPVSEEFGVAQTTIGIAPGLAIGMMGLMGVFVGRWLDRGLARRLMSAGVVLTGVGLLGLSQAATITQAALCWILLVCTGGALFGALPSMTLVANWFERRRGLALGVAVAGATLASWAGPAAAQLIMDLHDWRTAVASLGALTLAMAPIFGLFVIGRPEEVGQRPDGLGVEQESAADATSEALVDELPPREAGELLRDPQLYLVAVGFGLVLTSPIVLVGLLVPFGKTLGFSQQEATFFFLAMMPFSLAGKILIGGLADVAPLKPSIALVVIVNLLVWGLLSLEPGYAIFVATGALYGVGIGGAAPLQGVLMGRCFGRLNFGKASGLGGILAIPLLVAAQIGSQLMLGASGSYGATFAVQAGLLVLGGAMLALVRIPAARA